MPSCIPSACCSMLAICSSPMRSSNFSEPNSIAYIVEGSINFKLSSRPSKPFASYRARDSSFDRTWYASPSFWNFSVASGSSWFLSGCIFIASFM